MCYLEKGVKLSSHYGTTLAITESNFFQFFSRVGANRTVCDSQKGVSRADKAEGGGSSICVNTACITLNTFLLNDPILYLW